MSALSHDSLDSLAVGAAFLGSGGGGNPAYSLLVARRQLELYGAVPLLQLADLLDDDLVVPLGFMGAPLVGRERIPCDREVESVIQAIERTHGRPVRALTVTEIGGSNAFAPLHIAGKLGLPIVDADLIGRAFPELQMVSTTVHGFAPTECFMGDVFGNTVVINCPDLHRVEKYARQLTMAFGSSAPIVLHTFKGHEAKRLMIPGSVTRACEIGATILRAQREHGDVVRAVLALTKGRLLGSGMIMDVDQVISGGFLRGTVTVSASGTKSLKVIYQNEYLFVFDDGCRVASTPDIIVVLDAESHMPVTSDSLSFGLRVDILAVPGPEIWYTSAGMNLVGPQVFGANDGF